MTPLSSAVDEAVPEIVQFLRDMIIYSDTLSKSNAKQASNILNLKDIKGETPIIKAARMNKMDIVKILFTFSDYQKDGFDVMKWLTSADSSDKNLLHYAVINNDRTFIQQLIHFDSD